MSLSKDEKTMPLADIVPEYDSAFFLVKNLFWDRIRCAISQAEIGDSSTVLDVGCGIGHLLREIRTNNRHCQLFGIDFNINIENVRIPQCQLSIEDVRELSFADNRFDVVFALDTLEHIEDAERAIAQIRRVLKPDGKFIVSGPTESWFYKSCRFLIKGTFSEKEGPGTGVHHHTIDALDKKILQGGFVKKNQIRLPAVLPFVLFKILTYGKAE